MKTVKQMLCADLKPTRFMIDYTPKNQKNSKNVGHTNQGVVYRKPK